MALPALESLRPLSSLDASIIPRTAISSTGAPIRMAFMEFPNGALPQYWWPTGQPGTTFELNRTMQPLQSVKSKIQIISGLDHRNATPGPDGAGDHGRAGGTYLTGVRVRKTQGADIRAGISIDQVAANQVGHLTRFPSLEISSDVVRQTGNCDSGYSCAYQCNMAWSSPTTPVPPEPNPRAVFERLFGAGNHGERQANLLLRQQQQRSVLDFVLDDAHDIQQELSNRDRLRMDEYLTSFREIERRLAAAEAANRRTPDPDTTTPAGIPTDFQDYMRLMYSMMLLAFQTDSTRICTFLLAHDGDNRPYPQMNIPEGHHYLTHHQSNAAKIEKVAQIETWYMQQFAWFLEQMERTQDVDGNSLLHNSMLVIGCANADGNRHTHANLPIVLAGAGGGTLTTGRYTRVTAQPMCNLFLSMIDRMGVRGVERFGDSTGRLTGL
ncbi:MAG TPA: DUF1552 domain-containing protein [Gemmataceae bacterium]|nr:DUF1552 domain-containing protein [Gemmataceae bacterium]